MAFCKKGNPERNRAFALILFFLGSVPSVDAADGYVLDFQDKVRISVSEISSASGEVRVRLNGEFVVDAEGDVAIPSLGNIKAAGMSPSAFATSISLQFQAKVRLVNPPVTAVEILQHRPFYVIGAVEKPGEYPFRPGMRVVHAFSVAGGLARGPAGGQFRFERDAIQAKGDLDLLNAQRNKLEARRARLEATIDGKDKVAFPERLQSSSIEPSMREVIERERLLFDQFRTDRALELAKYHDELSLLDEQIRSLQMQLETQDDQTRSVTQELNQVRKLDGMGLANPGRAYTLERTAMTIVSKKKEIETEILKVRERISENEIAIKRLHETGHNELLAELHNVDSELENVTRKLATVQHLIQQIQADEADAGGRLEDTEIKYSIMREQNGALVEEAATETSRVRPGDVIKVSRQQTEVPSGQAVSDDLTAVEYQ